MIRNLLLLLTLVAVSSTGFSEPRPRPPVPVQPPIIVQPPVVVPAPRPLPHPKPLSEYLLGSWRVSNVQCPSPTGTWRQETWTFDQHGGLLIQIPGSQARGSYRILGPRLLSIVPPSSLVGSYTSKVSIVNENYFVWTWDGITTAGYRVCDIQFRRF